jgi:hypothetical protein
METPQIQTLAVAVVELEQVAAANCMLEVLEALA